MSAKPKYDTTQRSTVSGHTGDFQNALKVANALLKEAADKEKAEHRV